MNYKIDLFMNLIIIIEALQLSTNIKLTNYAKKK